MAIMPPGLRPTRPMPKPQSPRELAAAKQALAQRTMGENRRPNIPGRGSSQGR